MNPNLPRIVLLCGVLLALAAGGYFLLTEPERPLQPEATGGADGVAAAPEAGSLSDPAGAIERASAAESGGVPGVRGGGVNFAGAAEPKAWFRGSLRIVQGELPTAPRLEATVMPAGGNLSEPLSVALDARELSFAVPADSAAATCTLRLPDFLQPVQVLGEARLDGQDVVFAAPAEGVIVEVEVLPHAGVLFLHDPSGQPLANAEAWSELRDGEGSSTTWGGNLDADGMLYFDFARLRDFEEAKTVTFSVSRPPDVGHSSSPDFPTADLPLMPQPIVLRFASSQQLHFLVMDTDGKPIPDATIRVGGNDAGAVSGADGRIRALQTIPPAENLQAEAPGFVATWHGITSAAATEQLIVLARASWIELVGQEEPPGGWDELDAEFRYDGKADASALLGERFQPGRVRVSNGGSSTSNDRTDLRFQVRTSFSPEGRVLLDGIYADVPATVTVSYHGQTFLEQRVPLQPGDGAHRIELPPLPEFVPLRGVVVDATGAPLAGVRARSSTGGHSISSAETNAQGEFDLGMLAAGATVQLGFSKEGRGRQQMEFTGRAGDERSVGVVTLGAPRSLLVVVVAEDGAPFVPQAGTAGVGARPALSFFGESVEPTAQGAGPGEWLFDNLPGGTLRFALLNARGHELTDFSVTTSEPRAVLRLDAQTLAFLRAEE